MIGRRGFLGLAASAFCISPAMSALPAAPMRSLQFRIMRKGSQIGTHSLSFSGGPDALTVDIAVEMAVSLGPIRLFHYDHHNVERWTNGQFDSLMAKTDYDGEPAWCSVHREGGKIVVEGSKCEKYVAPPGTLPATHWNKAELQGPMINPENGMLLRPAVGDLGSDTVALASGKEVPATHYSWQGEDKIDLWYDAQNGWTALRALTRSGEILTYEKL
jgi:Family of unknown function (DUF6134)